MLPNKKIIEFPKKKKTTKPQNYEVIIEIRKARYDMELMYHIYQDERVLRTIDTLKMVEEMYRTNELMANLPEYNFQPHLNLNLM